MKAPSGTETGLGKDESAMNPLIVSLTTPESVPVRFVTSLLNVSTVNCQTIDSEGELNVNS